LPGWQKFYHDLNDKNFQIISIAQDTGGAKDAAPWITAAKPEYVALIDDKHLVTQLYNMVNVPTAVWINEKGMIVRPNEVAYVDNRYKAMHGIDAGPYLDAIRDWVAKGDASVYALSPDDVRRRMHGRTGSEALAAANFRLGQYLYQQGHHQAAQRSFAEAKRLHPENWSFKRQSWELEELGKASGPEFWAAVDALGEKPYYPPVNL